MKTRKKRNISFRSKKKKLRNKKFFLFFLAIVILAMFYFSTPYISKTFGEIKNFTLSSIKIKHITINGVSPETQNEILSAMQLKEGMPLSAIDTAKIKKEILQKFLYLKNISVSIDWIFAKLTITSSERVPLAVVFTAKKVSMADTEGDIYDDFNLLSAENKIKFATDNYPNLVPVYIEGKNNEKLPLKIVESIVSIKESKELFTYKPLILRYNSESEILYILLDDGSLINWGDFGFTKQKIIRINQGFEKISSREKGPYNIDLRFFANGRMIFSPMSETEKAEILQELKLWQNRKS